MSFLQSSLLYGLPLAALPVIIHLIHLYRRRTVKWAAMMFLLAAQRMNKGFSRLRRLLILAARVLAVAALIFVASRPLAGGWLGLTGGAPDTILILLDRSASMEQQNVSTGVSKRVAGLRNLAKAIKDSVGGRSHLVFIDSAEIKPTVLERPDALLDLPQSAATDTTADIPAMLQSALDYITRNKTGRTDVWMLSDLQAGDWDASGGRWEALRGAFSTLQGVRFRLLSYPQAAPDNVGITIERVIRRETTEKAELLLDIRILRHTEVTPAPLVEIPVRLVVNGVSSTFKVTMKEGDSQILLQAHAVPIDKTTKRGWGQVELPADSFLPDNQFFFVFDEPPVLRSIVVSDDTTQTGPLVAALSVSPDPSGHCEATVLTVNRAAEIPWDDAALLVWQAPLPGPSDILAKQMQNYVAEGRSILFLPPENPNDASLFGLRWGAWKKESQPKPLSPEWWRNDSGLLANTRDGAALPVGELEVMRHCEILGEGVPLARLAGQEPLLERSTGTNEGSAYFLGCLPGSGDSSLGRDGVVMFAMLHRALNDSSRGLGKAQQRYAAHGVLGSDPSKWHRTGPAKPEDAISSSLPLRAGVVESGDKLAALNRPPAEDRSEFLSSATLDGLFRGLNYERVEETLESTQSLTNEIWRTFLVAMMIALLVEALLCMPPKRNAAEEEKPAFGPKEAMKEREHSLA